MTDSHLARLNRMDYTELLDFCDYTAAKAQTPGADAADTSLHHAAVRATQTRARAHCANMGAADLVATIRDLDQARTTSGDHALTSWNIKATAAVAALTARDPEAKTALEDWHRGTTDHESPLAAVAATRTPGKDPAP